MNTETTPRPWKSFPTTPGGGSKGFAFIRGYDPHEAPIGKYIADVETEEDAALIVAAVNDHDDLAAENTRLREALENHIEVVAMNRADDDAQSYELLLREMADSARAALAQHGAAEANEQTKEVETMRTFADQVSKEEAEAEHKRLVREGVSDYEARAMVYEEPVPEAQHGAAEAAEFRAMVRRRNEHQSRREDEIYEQHIRELEQ